MLHVAGEPRTGENQECLLPLLQRLTLNHVHTEYDALAQDGAEIRGRLHFGPVEGWVGSDDPELHPVRQVAIHRPHLAQELLVSGPDHGPDENACGIAPDLLNLLQRHILAPDVTVEIFLVEGVQSFHGNDAYLHGERFAVDDLKSKVLIRLRAMEFTEAYQVGSIELIDDRLYYVFLMDDRLLCGKGNGRNEYGDHRR